MLKSSFVPNAEEIIVDAGGLAIINASTSNYADQYGAIVAIQVGKNFAPRAVNGLSVGSYTVTKDGKIMLPRRSSTVLHAPLVYNVFCGWMSTMNTVGKDRCEELTSALEYELYDAHWQARNEFKEESGLSEGDFALSSFPVSMIRGYDVSLNFGFVFTGKIHKTADEVRKAMLSGEEEFAPGRTEHDKIASVHTDHLEQLLRNQPELQKENPATFETSDPHGRDLILLDETLGGLVNAFPLLTGSGRPKDLIDHLGKGGIEINTIELKPGETYPL